MAYATIQDLENLLTQQGLASFLGGIETAERALLLQGHLLGAEGEINGALQKARYAVPIDASMISPAGLVDQTLAVLRNYTAILAAKMLAGGASDLPGGLKLLIEGAEQWKRDIQSEKAELLGVTRPTAIVQQDVAYPSFVATGEPFFPPGYHDRQRWQP